MRWDSACTIICKPVKKIVLILSVLFSALSLEAAGKDSLSVAERRGPDKLFMPKGDFSAGAQFFYADLSSTDSEYLMLLQHLDADGSMMTIAPYFDYTYKDNRSVGLRAKYSSAQGGVSNADFSMLSDDLAVSLSDIRGDSHTIQAEVYHRAYAALDKKGRFGVFTDMSLGYSYTRTSFSYNEESLDSYSAANRVKFAVHPGLMIFVTNSISTHVAIGIGGATYNHIDYYKNGEIVGTRDFSKVRFMLDVLDISFGLSFHI